MAELRTEIHAHLRQHPGLTALELGRALGRVPDTVRRTLRWMEEDGEAESRTRPRTDGSGRTASEWRAT